MSTSKRAGRHPFTQEPLPSEWALRDLPARAARFLHAAAVHRGIAELLARGGYRGEDHAEGLRLLERVCSYRASSPGLGDDERARAADREIREWVRTHVPRFRAAIERLHPEDVGLFEGLAVQDERAGALVVTTLLDRLRERQKGRAKRTDAVSKTLERRGFDHDEKARLSDLANRARAVGESASTELSTPEAEDAAPSADVVALAAWLTDWTMTAKTFIGRKDWLIRLGVVRRG